MKVTVFNDVNGAVKQEYDITWRQLSQAILNPTSYENKPACPLIKLARFGDIPRPSGSYRYDENVLAVSGIEGDYDGGELSPELAANLLQISGVQGAIYTSPSHTDQHPRWRVIAPLSEECSPDKRREYTARLNSVFDGLLATESFTLSQTYYFGKINCAHQYKAFIVEGVPIDRHVELPLRYPVGSKVNQQPAVVKKKTETLTQDQITDLLSALNKIPTDDYPVRIAVGQALKELGDLGYFLYQVWHASAGREFSNNSLDKWDTFDASRTGYQSIFQKATAYGWKNPGHRVDPTKYKFEKPAVTPQAESISLLRLMSIRDKIDELEKETADQEYIMGELALRGQSTIFYAPPNTGKTLLTLRLLVDAIDAGRFDADDLYYINCDDDYKGFFAKAKILRDKGAHTLGTGQLGFDPSHLPALLRDCIQKGVAHKTIIVMDTLGSFINSNDTGLSKILFDSIKEFVLNAGTVIILGHVNKNKSADGKLVFAGCTVSLNDVNAAYIVERHQRGDEMVAVFEATKTRGKNTRRAAYSYIDDKHTPYIDKYNSVKETTSEPGEFATKEKVISNVDEQVIVDITESIEAGFTNISMLIKEVCEIGGYSRDKVRNVFAEYKGANPERGARWFTVSAGRNKTVMLHSQQKKGPS